MDFTNLKLSIKLTPHTRVIQLLQVFEQKYLNYILSLYEFKNTLSLKSK